MAPETNPTSIRLSPELLAQIDEQAAALDRSRGWLIEQACKLYLDRRSNLPQVNWDSADERGSCGFGYQIDVHFNLPAMVGSDGAAYLLEEDIISRASAAGAREIWTSVHQVGSMQEPNSAKEEYLAWANGTYEEWSAKHEEVDVSELEPEDLRNGAKILDMACELREFTPAPTTVINNYYSTPEPATGGVVAMSPEEWASEPPTWFTSPDIEPFPPSVYKWIEEKGHTLNVSEAAGDTVDITENGVTYTMHAVDFNRLKEEIAKRDRCRHGRPECQCGGEG